MCFASDTTCLMGLVCHSVKLCGSSQMCLVESDIDGGTGILAKLTSLSSRRDAN